MPRLKKIWADAAYRGKELADWRQRQGEGWDLEVVERAAGAHGFQLLPRRWVVERSLAWLSRNRRLATDYERMVQTSETLIALAAVRLLLRRLKAPTDTVWTFRCQQDQVNRTEWTGPTPIEIRSILKDSRGYLPARGA